MCKIGSCVSDHKTVFVEIPVRRLVETLLFPSSTAGL